MSNVLKRHKYRTLEQAFRVDAQGEEAVQEAAVQDGSGEESPPPAAADAARDPVPAVEKWADSLVTEAAREAEQIKREAREMIEAWWDEKRAQDEQVRESIRQQAYEEGYRAGHDEGFSAGEKAWDERMAEARQLIADAHEAKQAIINEAEPFLVRLSTDIAEKVIARKIKWDRSVIADMVKRALAQCDQAGTVTVLVKPEHFSLVHDARQEFREHLDDEVELRIIPDHTLEDDGCIIRTQHGSVDARIEVQLNEIRNTLAEMAKEGAAPVDRTDDEVPAKLAKIESDSR